MDYMAKKNMDSGQEKTLAEEMTLGQAVQELWLEARRTDVNIFGERPQTEASTPKQSLDKITDARDSIMEITKLLSRCNDRLEILGK